MSTAPVSIFFPVLQRDAAQMATPRWYRCIVPRMPVIPWCLRGLRCVPAPRPSRLRDLPAPPPPVPCPSSPGRWSTRGLRPNHPARAPAGGGVWRAKPHISNLTHRHRLTDNCQPTLTPDRGFPPPLNTVTGPPPRRPPRSGPAPPMARPPPPASPPPRPRGSTARSMPLRIAGVPLRLVHDRTNPLRCVTGLGYIYLANEIFSFLLARCQQHNKQTNPDPDSTSPHSARGGGRVAARSSYGKKGW